MSMTLTLQFFRDRDDPKLSAMLDVLDACTIAGVVLPEEVTKFLEPVREEFGSLNVERQQAVDAMLSLGPADQHKYVYGADYREGFEVDMTKLPEGTRFVRFYYSR